MAHTHNGNAPPCLACPTQVNAAMLPPLGIVKLCGVLLTYGVLTEKFPQQVRSTFVSAAPRSAAKGLCVWRQQQRWPAVLSAYNFLPAVVGVPGA